MFAVLMIVLNGVVGLALLVGGLRHHEQAYNLQGAVAYLAVIIPRLSRLFCPASQRRFLSAA
jgi:Ca2+:H+ antiporter